ncbi:MAG: sulfite exporter TauE/SafE family protein [Spirochaetales bacterium]|nr:sulfite exporter TauE/SafE family protein [Spirochaetales bacterium]
MLIIFFSTLIQATFSFGGALIALPLLSLFMEIKTAVPLMALVLGILAVVIILEHWKDIHFQSAWRLIVSAFVGIPLGMVFLRLADEKILKAVLAVTVIIFAFINLLKIGKFKQSNYRYAFLFGFISGLFGSAFNITGPPIVIFGTITNLSPVLFRATLHSYFLFTNIFTSIGHFLAGNITGEVSAYFFLALPVIVLSSILGKHFSKRIPEASFTLIVKIMMLILGVNLLVSVLF